MRIAIFSDNFYPELSGIADSITKTGEVLAGRGHDIAFFAPAYSKKDYATLNLAEDEPDRGSRIEISRLFSIPYPTGTGQGRLVIPAGTAFSRVKRFRPDLIHVHVPLGAGLEGMMAASRLKRPLVGTNHTPTKEFVRYSPLHGKWVARLLTRYVSWFYNHCRFMSAPSQSIFDEMHPFGFHAPHGVISNPLDSHLFYPLPASKKAAIRRDLGFRGFTLLYAGRLAPEKNIDLIIWAMARLKDKIPDLELTLTGKGSAEKNLRTLTESLGLETQVHFLGFVPHDRLPDVYNAGDAFVMMSTAETQSLAMMQAMLVAMPVLAARAWGLPEYVKPGTGFLVPPGDVETLAKKILALYLQPKLRKNMGKNARHFARQFSPAIIATKWEQVYRKVIREYREKNESR